jgi:hypothetical protein
MMKSCSRSRGVPRLLSFASIALWDSNVTLPHNGGAAW